MPVQNRWYFSACVHHRCLFSARTSSAKSRSRCVFAWSRALIEAIVEPKQASTPGDKRLPRAQAVHVSFFADGEPPNKNCHLRACARGKHVSPEVPARLCSTIPSMKALDHANTHLLLLCPDKVRAANKQRWCTQP